MIVRDDRSVLEILDADYTFVDERLARFYGINGIRGSQLRRVGVTGTQRGGGVPSHASILTITSHSTRTAPVLRGKWILANLLNDPPPPSVPALDETKIGQAVSLRQEMQLHRQDAACASCRARLDPLGFGLKHFDAIGSWRDQDGAEPVDAFGALPSGRSFRGNHELKQIQLDERDAFVRGLTEKLMIYALGRGLERFDRPLVEKISARLAESDYRFSESGPGNCGKQAVSNAEPLRAGCRCDPQRGNFSMSLIINGKHLPRRTLLKGAGASIALPQLNTMRSAVAASANTSPVRRVAVVYVPNGIIMKDWLPETTGQGFSFPRILKPLEPFRNHVTVISGLENTATTKAKGGGHTKA